MRPDGFETTALWREAGEWWNGEPYREVRRYRDAKGINRESDTLLPSLGNLEANTQEYEEDHREEWSLRTRKSRDEKVSMACGEKFEPYRVSGNNASTIATLPHASSYAALHVCTGYSFGRGSMLADEAAAYAAAGGLSAAAIVDSHSLIGAVEFVKSCKKHGIKPIVGASIELPEGGEIVLLATNKQGYTNLSLLVSACHMEEPRQYPLGSWQRLERYSQGLLCLTGGDKGPLNCLLAHRDYKSAKAITEQLQRIYGPMLAIEIERSYVPWESTVNNALIQLAKHFELMAIAGGLVTHARREHYPVQDVLVCANTLCTVDEIIGRKERRHPCQPQVRSKPERALNGERFLRTAREFSMLFADLPELVANTERLAALCEDDVLPPRTCLPELFPHPHHALREITEAGAHLLHPKVTPALRKRLHYELDRIAGMNFSSHFLIMWDACRWAADQRIHFSGRGSVVDSAVAYCLGFSRIDAFKHRLHFDRFLPGDGSKRPDIDIDFEAHRREDVRQYLVLKYGEDRVATVAAIGAYCTRGIVREVGKVFGMPPELIGFLSKRIHGGISPASLQAALDARPELRDSGVPKERFQWVFKLAERLQDIPRNMRAHSSGVVISDRPIAETVPVMYSASIVDEEAESEQRGNLRIIQWDKRSAKPYFDKFDILCLRGQDVLSGTEERIRLTNTDFNVQRIPSDDPETYRAMRSGELIGIPQSASPAMRQAHIRLRTNDLHDASLVQAGIRPGVGGAVKLNELIARRRGKPYTFEHPEFENILGLTYGIIVFQEQVDQLLQTFAGYTSGEAEDTREAIHKNRREDYGKSIRDELIDRVKANGFSLSIAEQVYDYVAGFKGYGFAQGHALAFAEISLRSIYCQQNFPSEYFASLLSAQPAGYYGPCTLVNEARTRGVAILPPDVNRSEILFTVEDIRSPTEPHICLPNGAIRTGLMQIDSISRALKERIASRAVRNPAIGEMKMTDLALQSRAQVWNQSANSNPKSISARAVHGPVIGARTATALAPAPIYSVQSPIPNPKFLSLFDFVAKTDPDRDELEQLILCGALDSLHRNRRAMLWAIPSALDYAVAYKDCKEHSRLPIELLEPSIPNDVEDFTEIEKAIYERAVLGLDVERHLMAYERPRIIAKGGITTADARRLPGGRKAIVVGNPIRLRFPPTPSGKRVVFFDLEDETGLLNVTCFDAVYRRDGHSIVCSPYVTLIGESQDRDGHIAFLAQRVFSYNPTVAQNRKEKLPVVTGDFLCG